ncbi:unnamed protein product [Ceratitis capitata]|uniref:(Mediterranean fruit fly) hypothetical protein n=1 Tax=Ceratitis capitata TaxID=7213 RepID=A0A811VFM8_CERCA|nr:unnamed protein product [Ceratitis capitata]
MRNQNNNLTKIELKQKIIKYLNAYNSAASHRLQTAPLRKRSNTPGGLAPLHQTHRTQPFFNSVKKQTFNRP